MTEKTVMMEEELISFETAKLAKEKGFDWECELVYNELDAITTDFIIDAFNKIIFEKYAPLIYLAPTQCQLQKWLRIKHKIHIKIEAVAPHEVYRSILQLLDLPENRTTPAKLGYQNIINVQTTETPEEALEIGLQKALKSIP